MTELINLPRIIPFLLITLMSLRECSVGTRSETQELASVTAGPIEEIPADATNTSVPATALPASATPEIVHLLQPIEPPVGGKLVYDVVSETTGPEKRAPYGDSYDVDLLERPFLRDMTYVPDLDIFTFTVVKDDNFWYVRVELVGVDPNNTLGINYGLELDMDYDGFGDYIIWATPPYSPDWETTPIQIYQDTNHDTGGLSSEKSDAPLAGDGYDTLVFNGGQGDEDPDIAWIRIHESPRSTIQFAFKREWSGMFFMLGVISDAGLRDVGQYDYVDRFEEQDAGSPVKEKPNYPLGELYAFDNTCRDPFGVVKRTTGFEPRLCPPQPAPPRP
jgi:hypothetical protein